MLPKTKMPALRVDQHIVKIAVKFENQQAQLIEFDQHQPLTGIIQDLCNNWNITDAENYALQFCEHNNRNYVTERNRSDVKNGSVLELKLSPSKTANDILYVLQNDTNIKEKIKHLERLADLCSDITFAMEFIKESGLNLIITMVEDDKCNEMLTYVLQSFVETMEHGTVSWDILESTFISRNIEFINNTEKYGHLPKSEIIVQSALSILDNVVQNSSKAGLVEKEVTFDILLHLLQKGNQTIQQNTISLINSLFQKADENRKKTIALELSKKEYRDAILNNVINTKTGAEMAHQLYVLQTLTLGLLEQRMLTKMNPQDNDALEKIKDLRKIIFNDHSESTQDVTTRRQTNAPNTFKKLGFKCDYNPAQDFNETPPGMLALDCMIYFARNYTSICTKVVHENTCRADENECPFGRTSIELVKMLCEILKIGEPPFEQGQDFYPMFFTHDHPFEELFCICIEVLNKTWKDMRATNDDFAMVFSVVNEQITRSLKERPANLNDFKTKIKTLNYATITSIRQQERNSIEECKSTSSAIISLKEKLTPEIMELIKLQRLGYLVEGTRFSKFSLSRGRTKDKFWYVRLSPNHKVIHHGDCDEKTVPSLEELTNKINVIDIKQLLVGKECPHMKRKSTTHLGFSITIDNGENKTLDFVAPDEMTFNYWTDGLNALLNQPMVSKQKEEDFETLLSMEIKLRLLDTERVDISSEPPPIPEDPENYDFCFES